VARVIRRLETIGTLYSVNFKVARVIRRLETIGTLYYVNFKVFLYMDRKQKIKLEDL